ncbi:MAG: hypothetical protein O3A71_06345 [Proteobacteria bacterium]|nr:hypothetical protein [Pseudomonadota bacterium]MDA0896423.1 hypothetical protein [Pseudomonadota bacterium]
MTVSICRYMVFQARAGALMVQSPVASIGFRLILTISLGYSIIRPVSKESEAPPCG